MMRSGPIIVSIALIALFSSCAEPPEPRQKEAVRVEPETPPSEPFKPTLHEYELSMYNDPYFLTTASRLDPATKDVVVDILLMQKADTAISHRLELDSIAAHYYDYMNTDSLDQIDFSNYRLSEVKYDFVRTNSLYLSAFMVSQSKADTVVAGLKFKYFGKDQGKYYVNVL